MSTEQVVNKKNKKKWIIPIATLGVVLAIGAGAAGYTSYQNNQYVEENITAEYMDVFNQLEFSGNIEPNETRAVYSVVNQVKVTEVCVKNGDFVHKGDPLVLLDATGISFEIKEKELALEQTKLEYENDLLTAQTAASVGSKEGVVTKSEAVKLAQAEYDSVLMKYNMAYQAYSSEQTPEIISAKNTLREAYVNLDILPEDDFEGRSVRGTAVSSAQETLRIAKQSAKQEVDLLALELTKAEVALNAAKAEYSAAAGSSKKDNSELQSKANILEGSNIVEQKELEIEKLKADLENYTIRAQCDGYVSALTVKEGDATDNKVLMNILDYDSMKIVIDVDEYDIKAFRVGDPIRIYIPSVDSYYDGEVSMISTEATKKNELSYIQVTISFTPDRMISSGLGGTVYTVPGEDVNQLAIPTDCLLYDTATGERYVMVQTDAGEEKRVVEVGDSDGDYTAILTGLTEGDIIVSWNDEGDWDE